MVTICVELPLLKTKIAYFEILSLPCPEPSGQNWDCKICWRGIYICAIGSLKREDHIYKEFWLLSIQVSETLERENICSYVFLIAICYILSFIRLMVANKHKIILLFFPCHAFIFKYFRITLWHTVGTRMCFKKIKWLEQRLN